MASEGRYPVGFTDAVDFQLPETARTRILSAIDAGVPDDTEPFLSEITAAISEAIWSKNLAMSRKTEHDRWKKLIAASEAFRSALDSMPASARHHFLHTGYSLSDIDDGHRQAELAICKAYPAAKPELSGAGRGRDPYLVTMAARAGIALSRIGFELSTYRPDERPKSVYWQLVEICLELCGHDNNSDIRGILRAAIKQLGQPQWGEETNQKTA